MEYIVYKHTCPNHRAYIGITKMDPEKRWVGGLGYKSCSRFFTSIVKYGWDNIKHEILESGLTYAEAKKKETEYIERFNTTEEQFGYNQTYGVGQKGRRRSLETREKLRQAQLGRKASPELRKKLSEAHIGKYRGKDCWNSKKIYQYDLDGNFIKEWASRMDVARFYHCSPSHIGECAKGRKKHAMGYVWKDERV